MDGKKKKNCGGTMGKEEGQNSKEKKSTALARPRVPFHIASLPRPQEEYNIIVNNRNEPFQHVWLKRSEDGSRVIHPLEMHSELDFVDRQITSVELVKPLPLECTPFKLVEEVKELKELVAKLHAVDEFAVDLEHNKYRSFQGLTCLMQISTRTEDFVVDTLKLRIHIGPYLRDLFKSTSKKKVMHGAELDILWLQRDFSIYVCNLFDTGQASKVLQLERNSLEYLLNSFCGVDVNKEYQHADWRQRPLPDEMLKYAREDTHYLLHIYDIMRSQLISASRSSEDGNDLLLEVYKRSYDVCLQLYEKELLTDTSYLHIYGLQGADFNAHQLSIVAGLCEWRDTVARMNDESTGYILPNKALLDIARQMPLTSGKLRQLVKSKHPFVECNLISVLDVIHSSIKNAAAFESAAQELRNEYQESDVHRLNGQATDYSTPAIDIKEEPLQIGGQMSGFSRLNQGHSFHPSGKGQEVKKKLGGHPPDILKESFIISERTRDRYTKTSPLQLDKVVPRATVKVTIKPNPNFGVSKRKSDSDPNEKMEQTTSPIVVPFHLFKGRNEQLKPLAADCGQEIQQLRESSGMHAGNTKLQNFTLGLKPAHTGNSREIRHPGDQQPSYDFQRATSSEYPTLREAFGTTRQGNRGSQSQLPSSFHKGLQLTSQATKAKDVARETREMERNVQATAYDCPEARDQMRRGKNHGEGVHIESDGSQRDLLTSLERCKNSEINRVPRDKETEFAAG